VGKIYSHNGIRKKRKKALSTFIDDLSLLHLDEIKLFIEGKALQLGVVTRAAKDMVDFLLDFSQSSSSARRRENALGRLAKASSMYLLQ
jgi:hypothetical protein